MNIRCRFCLLIVGLLVMLPLIAGGMALAQSADVSDEDLAAVAEFDRKFFNLDYIAYSGLDWEMKQAMAVSIQENYDDMDPLSSGVASQVPVTDTIDGLAAELVLEEINKAQSYSWLVPEGLAISDTEIENGSMIAETYAHWVAQQALAVSVQEDFENKALDAQSIAIDGPRPTYVPHGMADWVAPGNLAISESEDFDDKGLPVVGIAGQVPETGEIDGLVAQRALEEFYKAQNYGLDSQAEMDFAQHILCWDRKFFLSGHVVCPEEPVAVEPTQPGS